VPSRHPERVFVILSESQTSRRISLLRVPFRHLDLVERTLGSVFRFVISTLWREPLVPCSVSSSRPCGENPWFRVPECHKGFLGFARNDRTVILSESQTSRRIPWFRVPFRHLDLVERSLGYVFRNLSFTIHYSQF
jgi:hypothetical protein